MTRMIYDDEFGYRYQAAIACKRTRYAMLLGVGSGEPDKHDPWNMVSVV